MNRNVLETQWPQIREILREKFSNLTDEDIRQINGRYDQLVEKLQQKYGYTRDEAEERIKNWNFDRLKGSGEILRDDKFKREDIRVKKEEDNSSLWKWLLGLGIPLLLLGAYFLSMPRATEVTQTPAAANQQIIGETAADRAISDSLRNAILSQNRALAAQNIQIATRNGIVTLSGVVPDREIRNAIEAAAINHSGVRQVINNLQVR